MLYFQDMSYDDPDLYEEEEPECSCNRAIPRGDMLIYEIPRALPGGGTIVDTVTFDKNCPVHGYTIISAS